MTNNNNKKIQNEKNVTGNIENQEQPAFQLMQHNAQRSENIEMNSLDPKYPNRPNQ
jgi:hypothetical protein